MSSSQPDQPEYLGSSPGTPGSPAGARRGRRTAVVAAAAVATVAAVGAGAYGVVQVMAGGSSPASAVPADALGYVSLDLDPSAAQKIEAVRIMRKFPALRDELRISSRDDLRRAIVREIQRDGDCPDLDYADDVEPWIGDRVAVAGVPGSRSGQVLPLVALQVSDQDAARTGVRALARCSGDDGDQVAFASSGDYLLLSEKQADVDAMAEDAESASLEDDGDFTTWMGRTGESGIVTMYASKAAASAVVDASETAAGSTGSARSRQLAAAVRGFEGAAGVIRFDDGAVEAEFAAKGLGEGLGGIDGERGPDVTTLPGSTAVALSVALQDGWLDDSMTGFRSTFGDGFDDAMAQAEQQTGLQLPEDVETLLGEGVSISVDSSADLEAIAKAPDPASIPAGVRITGDAAKITAVIDKLKAAAGPRSDVVVVRSRGDLVAVGTDRGYVDSLLQDGDLGDSAAFREVVPEAGRASGVFFVDFDAGGWSERLADLGSDGDASVRENVKPLDALGVSSWEDDDAVQHSMLRLTTQ